MSPNTKVITTESREERPQDDDKKPVKWRRLPEKSFELRNSLLTELFESNPHIKTIHHVFIATLICLFVNTVVHDYVKKGEIKVGFHLIYLSFGKLYITALSWLGFLCTTSLCYVSFVVWARIRVRFLPKARSIKTWDTLWILSLAAYYVMSFRIAALIVTKFHLPPASASIVLLEQVRLTMKTHAFVRSNVTKVLSYKPHSDEELDLPSYYTFFYFLFAPTIVYRDDYPRTKTIRWNFVMYRLLEIAGVIFYYSFLLHRFLLPFYQDFGIRKYTWHEIILNIFENAIIGILILLATFFLVLHSVQNLFAELLKFGDRLFYKDWWTCTSYSEYFRTWNIVVHDWLYTYVYKDMYELVVPRNKTAAKLTVFILSAVVHEWVLTYMFGFFFPALFVQFFFFGALFSFFTAPKVTILNILFWYGLQFGSGVLISMYTLEYYARYNMPVKGSSYWEYLMPRFLTCDCIR